MKALIIVLMMYAGTAALAQSGTAPQNVHFYHQLFMPDTIQSVQKVIYAEDSSAVNFRLSDDKTTIYLMDYDGKRSIKVYYTEKTGVPKDVQKPHCQVQDMRVEL